MRLRRKGIDCKSDSQDGELFPTVERREFSAKEWRDYMEYQEKQADEAVEVIHKIRADNRMPKSAAARTYRRDA